ncbi:MAG: hypothetical protein HOC71_10005 [Candidatus Latescibacteria bacterium]|jgi:hypothetical protein|nr:hypothetical protein [Candidatus Latescibacterota bacterium]
MKVKIIAGPFALITVLVMIVVFTVVNQPDSKTNVTVNSQPSLGDVSGYSSCSARKGDTSDCSAHADCDKNCTGTTECSCGGKCEKHKVQAYSLGDVTTYKGGCAGKAEQQCLQAKSE